MIQKDTGGPAYPCKVYTRSGHPNGESMGMTLRDYFAGQAMPWIGINAWADDATINENAKIAAVWAYAVADAMIAARDAT